jgi:ribosome-associated heat shock protein Hsp15
LAADASRIRLDKWLWHARFCKTRAVAARLVDAGHVRVNGVHAAKPSAQVGPGDVVVFPQGGRTRAVRVVAPGVRRGPAAEAQTLYADLDASPPGGTD